MTKKSQLPSFKMIETMAYLWKEDTKQMFVTGLRVKIISGFIRSGSFFALYEHLNEKLKRTWHKNQTRKSLMGNLDKTFGPSAVASLTARFISATLSYPWEYKSKALQSMKGYNKKLNKKKNFTSGFVSTMGRDMVHYAVFFPIYELFKEYFKQNYLKNQYLSIGAASVIAGFSASIASYPFELIATLRISHEKANRGKSSYSILKKCVDRSGLSAVVHAIKPYSTRMCWGNFVFFLVYESSKNLFNVYPERIRRKTALFKGVDGGCGPSLSSFISCLARPGNGYIYSRGRL